MRRTALGMSVAPLQRRSLSNSFLDVLRHNVGFGENPHVWLPIAQRDRFQRVDARPLSACPDCRSEAERIRLALVPGDLLAVPPVEALLTGMRQWRDRLTSR